MILTKEDNNEYVYLTDGELVYEINIDELKVDVHGTAMEGNPIPDLLNECDSIEYLLPELEDELRHADEYKEELSSFAVNKLALYIAERMR